MFSTTTSESVSARQTRRSQTQRLSTLTHARETPIASSSKLPKDSPSVKQTSPSDLQASISTNLNDSKASKVPKRVLGKGKQKESVSDGEAPSGVIVAAGPRRKRRKLFDDENGSTNGHLSLHLSGQPSPSNSAIVAHSSDPPPLSSFPVKKTRDKHRGAKGESTKFYHYTPESSTPLRTTITIPPRSPAKPPEIPNRPSVGGKTVAGKTIAGYNSNVVAIPTPLQSKPSIKRIKLLVREPPPLISRPDQRPPPPRFGKSLPAFLTSYKWIDDREYDPASLEKAAVKEARIRNKIASLRQDGRLTLDAEAALALRGMVDRDARSVSAAYKERERPTDVWSSVVQSVIHHKHSKAWTGKQICAYIATKIRSYWDNEASKEGKAKAAEEKRLRALAKSTLKLVNSEWKKAVYVGVLHYFKRCC